ANTSPTIEVCCTTGISLAPLGLLARHGHMMIIGRTATGQDSTTSQNQVSCPARLRLSGMATAVATMKQYDQRARVCPSLTASVSLPVSRSVGMSRTLLAISRAEAISPWETAPTTA